MIHNGDALNILKTFSDNTFDSVVTDPPYGISFMNKHWDYDVPEIKLWSEVLRVLKPGGHCLVACGTRTQHRMAVNLEDAGFEIRDLIAWIYGSGFPKSLNVGKAVDKLQDTSEFEGYGTALKPAMELWTLCRKPLSEKSVAENVLKWGTGGINIDGCRVETSDVYSYKKCGGSSFNVGGGIDGTREYPAENNPQGRFPANIIHDGSEEVLRLFPETKVGARRKGQLRHTKDGDINFTGNTYTTKDYPANEGSASRFFYCAKASKSERNAGLEGFEERENSGSYEFRVDGSLDGKPTKPKANFHPTVKPVSLMRYLCRLITPKNGTVLDCFMGSGSTGIGAVLEGFNFTGIEKEKEYCEIAEARIEHYKINFKKVI